MITVRTINPPRSRLEARIGMAARKFADESTAIADPWFIAACVYEDRVELTRVVQSSVPELRRTLSLCGVGDHEVRVLFTSPGLDPSALGLKGLASMETSSAV